MHVVIFMKIHEVNMCHMTCHDIVFANLHRMNGCFKTSVVSPWKSCVEIVSHRRAVDAWFLSSASFAPNWHARTLDVLGTAGLAKMDVGSRPPRFEKVR